MVYDVKKTLPLATEIRGIIIETYESLQLLPDEKAKKRHLDALEKELKEKYTPRMKRLSLRQGKLLIKLVDRQCDQNAYQLIRLFMGSFKAAFYQSFASLFGASLKKSYEPWVRMHSPSAWSSKCSQAIYDYRSAVIVSRAFLRFYLHLL